MELEGNIGNDIVMIGKNQTQGLISRWEGSHPLSEFSQTPAGQPGKDAGDQTYVL